MRYSTLFYFFIFYFFVLIKHSRFDRWAKFTLFIGSFLAVSLFVMSNNGDLPDWYIFKNYNIYQGNKSIALGIFMSISSAWMLHESLVITNKRIALVWLAASLAVATVVVFLAVTRTGTILWILLSTLVVLRFVKFNPKGFLIIFFTLVALILVLDSSKVASNRISRTGKAVSDFIRLGKIGDGDANRVQFFAMTWEMIEEKPLLGHGIGGWRKNYPVHSVGMETAKMNNPHNDYLLHTAEMGVIGLTAIIFVFAALAYTAINSGHATGTPLLIVTVELMVSCLFNGILRDWRFGIPFMALLAIAYREIINLSPNLNKLD